MSIKRIVAFTSIRSDYDLLSDLYKKIHQSSDMEIGLIVSGAHLSPLYGETYKQIEKDRIPILAKIETLISSDSNSARVKTASLLMQNCLHTVEGYNPDVILFAGDREDAMVAALVGSYLKIPTIHLFGGDHASDGNVDNPIRHACSKLSSLHFVTHLEHKKRLKAIGEDENRVFVVGNPALDKFKSMKYIQKDALLDKLNRNAWNNYAMVIFHPILSEEENAGEYMKQILSSLEKKNINAFVSYPNTDGGNYHIIEVINEYKNNPNFCFYKNLDRELFINLMRNAAFLIGNSSSGLLEAPIVPLGVINVGLRQRGRLAAENVIFVDQDLVQINQAIDTVTSKLFHEKLKEVESPYGNGNSVEKIYSLLNEIDFTEYLYKPEDPLNL
ncbi:UDP-N-acetylglucosamine 2-epimerase [Ornithinibacillus xuwenensis]|uniref:UDP-N-acetylglucosamine 2-epimerase n=1 Tax=Ornithinibacillus xuwenensis TaxID=3144668 RepID=A0ABU9XK71_9BACI